ncbi:MAG: helix-turn-helix domain-containing protein [Clostridia bacterium]|nr:helix-turn-helix domain-containing protein [Clostridia bacterium]
MKPIGNEGPQRLEQSVEIGTLCAFYGGLLTDRQLDALRLHYEEDLSLGEIAEELGVSRQNVHELITRSVQKLRRYEQALGAAQRAEQTAKTLRQALELMDGADAKLEEARALIGQIIRQQEGE